MTSDRHAFEQMTLHAFDVLDHAGPGASVHGWRYDCGCAAVVVMQKGQRLSQSMTHCGEGCDDPLTRPIPVPFLGAEEGADATTTQKL